ncbi:MAG: galactokinase [Saprospiraceae bacterium]|nr:galactokinase [Saprospiraceae bacterium]
MHSHILQQFHDLFPGKAPVLVRAPGRFNLIGEHTDYNLGWVLPGAIDKCLWLALAPADRCDIQALDTGERQAFHPGEPAAPGSPGWTAYFTAVVQELRERGHPVGAFCGVFGGDIPVGAGLSSSAALCCGLIGALAVLFQFPVERREIARIAQAAEHRIGLNCGPMDQYAVLFGKKDRLILLDCQALDFQYVPLHTGDYALVLLHSGVHHALAAGSGYNDRRASCERVVGFLQKENPALKSLRDLSPTLLQSRRAELDPVDYRRAAYVLAENERVLRIAAALNDGNLIELGRLLYEAHDGLRYAYEVTVPEIDLLVDLARAETAVLGARMVGGGFGGCTLNLVHRAEKTAVVERISAAYFEKTGLRPQPIEVAASEGLQVF